MPRMLRHRASIVAVGCLTMSAAIVIAQSRDKAPPPKPGHVMLDAAQLTFAAGPPGLPPGAELAVLDGDPSKAGAFAIRVKVPDGYTVPPHWHPTTENLVILSGSLMMGVGDKIDEASMHALGPGAYAKMPGKMHHYVRAKGATTFQVYGTGPFAITYVNPKDDPRKKTSP